MNLLNGLIILSLCFPLTSFGQVKKGGASTSSGMEIYQKLAGPWEATHRSITKMAMENCAKRLASKDIKGRNLPNNLLENMSDSCVLIRPNIDPAKSLYSSLMPALNFSQNNTEEIWSEANKIAFKNSLFARFKMDFKFFGKVDGREASVNKMCGLISSELKYKITKKLCDRHPELKTIIASAYDKAVADNKKNPISDMKNALVLPEIIRKDSEEFCRSAHEQYLAEVEKTKPAQSSGTASPEIKMMTDADLEALKKVKINDPMRTPAKPQFDASKFSGLFALGNVVKDAIANYQAAMASTPIGQLLITDNFRNKIGGFGKNMAQECMQKGKIFNQVSNKDVAEATTEYFKLLDSDIKQIGSNMSAYYDDGYWGLDKKEVIQNYIKNNPVTIAELLDKTNNPQTADKVCDIIGEIYQADQNKKNANMAIGVGGAIIGIASTIATFGGSVGGTLAILGWISTDGAAIYGAKLLLYDNIKLKKDREITTQAVASMQISLIDGLERIKGINQERKANTALAEKYIGGAIASNLLQWASNVYAKSQSFKVLKKALDSAEEKTKVAIQAGTKQAHSAAIKIGKGEAFFRGLKLEEQQMLGAVYLNTKEANREKFIVDFFNSSKADQQKFLVALSQRLPSMANNIEKASRLSSIESMTNYSGKYVSAELKGTTLLNGRPAIDVTIRIPKGDTVSEALIFVNDKGYYEIGGLRIAETNNQALVIAKAVEAAQSRGIKLVLDGKELSSFENSQAIYERLKDLGVKRTDIGEGLIQLSMSENAPAFLKNVNIQHAQKLQDFYEGALYFPNSSLPAGDRQIKFMKYVGDIKSGALYDAFSAQTYEQKSLALQKGGFSVADANDIIAQNLVGRPSDAANPEVAKWLNVPQHKIDLQVMTNTKFQEGFKAASKASTYEQKSLALQQAGLPVDKANTVIAKGLVGVPSDMKNPAVSKWLSLPTGSAEKGNTLSLKSLLEYSKTPNKMVSVVKSSNGGGMSYILKNPSGPKFVGISLSEEIGDTFKTKSLALKVGAVDGSADHLAFMIYKAAKDAEVSGYKVHMNLQDISDPVLRKQIQDLFTNWGVGAVRESISTAYKKIPLFEIDLSKLAKGGPEISDKFLGASNSIISAGLSKTVSAGPNDIKNNFLSVINNSKIGENPHLDLNLNRSNRYIIAVSGMEHFRPDANDPKWAAYFAELKRNPPEVIGSPIALTSEQMRNQTQLDKSLMDAHNLFKDTPVYEHSPEQLKTIYKKLVEGGWTEKQADFLIRNGFTGTLDGAGEVVSKVVTQAPGVAMNPVGQGIELGNFKIDNRSYRVTKGSNPFFPENAVITVQDANKLSGKYEISKSTVVFTPDSPDVSLNGRMEISFSGANISDDAKMLGILSARQQAPANAVVTSLVSSELSADDLRVLKVMESKGWATAVPGQGWNGAATTYIINSVDVNKDVLKAIANVSSNINRAPEIIKVVGLEKRGLQIFQELDELNNPKIILKDNGGAILGVGTFKYKTDGGIKGYVLSPNIYAGNENQGLEYLLYSAGKKVYKDTPVFGSMGSFSSDKNVLELMKANGLVKPTGASGMFEIPAAVNSEKVVNAIFEQSRNMGAPNASRFLKSVSSSLTNSPEEAEKVSIIMRGNKYQIVKGTKEIAAVSFERSGSDLIYRIPEGHEVTPLEGFLYLRAANDLGKAGTVQIIAKTPNVTINTLQDVGSLEPLLNKGFIVKPVPQSVAIEGKVETALGFGK